ncbi:hypothetical protein [Nocardioides alkalitolerans]|uniref:hypothetical protein n=1 Tax=Nocardioides alkalitolerans TaxID=281714 RepID=UPI0004054F51|nr:hypothetical protein [Nocardioides alkalitolerans]
MGVSQNPAKKAAAKNTPARRAPAKKTTTSPRAPRTARPAAAKQPTDRQTKTNAVTTFVGLDGETYTLPTIGEDIGAKVPGGITKAAIMNPDDRMAQLRLTFATIESVEMAAETRAALEALTTEEMLKVAARWMGESKGSSV